MQPFATGRQEFLDQTFNARTYVEVFYAPESNFVKDCLTDMHKEFSNIFTSGLVKGDTLLDFAIAPSIHHVLPACEAFKEVTMTNMTQAGFEELQKWYNNDPGAIDWVTYMKKVSTEGKEDEWQKKIEKLKEVVQQIVKCNLHETHPLSPLELAPFDCLTSVFCLGCICLDKESYVSCLRNMSSLLKPGGKLVILESVNGTFYIDGKYKYPYMYMNEKFLRDSLSEAGFITEKQIVTPRSRNQDFDSADYEAFVIAVARKA